MDYVRADPIEEVVTSKGRFRILRLLCRTRELNISEIARKTNLAYISANQHLKILKRFGLVEEKTFGRIRIFRYREEDKKCQILKQFFDNCETLHS